MYVTHIKYKLNLPYFRAIFVFFKRDVMYTVNDNTRNEIFDEEDQLKKYEDVDLNPNHTHFILVDDGSCGSYGKEIEFRAKLENELRKGKSNLYYENCRLSKTKRQLSNSFDRNCEIANEKITDDYFNENASEELKPGLKKDIIPMVMIVVQGGWTTLKVVEDAIKKNVPILVLAVN